MSTTETHSKHLSAPASFQHAHDQITAPDAQPSRITREDVPMELASILWNPPKELEHAASSINLSSNTRRYSAKYQPEEHSVRLKKEEEKRLSWLADKGYKTLCAYFKEAKGYPTNEIGLLSSPLLMEQIFHLEKIVTGKNSELSHSEAPEILDFALNIAKTAANNDHPNLSDLTTPPVENAISLIGKLIFICDQDASYFVNNLKSLHPSKLTNAIHLFFNKHVVSIKASLMALKADHQKTGLQDAAVATTVALPIALSKCLVTSIGEINTGLIPYLIDNFIENPEKAINHEINLLYGLKLFLHSPHCRHHFSQVEGPVSHNISSQSMVRIMLGIPQDKPVSKVDAQMAAMAGMLSHLRQTPSGTCFAESLAIELLSSQLEQCLTDFIEIIRDGKLTRKIKEKVIEFPFLFSSEKQKKKLPISIHGKLLNITDPKVYLWESPGMIAVCKALNLETPKIAVKNSIKRLLSGQSKHKAITIDQMLKELVLEKTSKESHQFKNLYALASFAYESQMSNPLLKLWRNAIAGMAEAHEGSMIKSLIIESIKHALDVTFKGTSVKQTEWIKKYYDEISLNLARQIQLEYDPNISRNDAAAPHHALGGAFVLYDKNGTPDFNDWIRIDTPQKFQEFIIRILKKAKYEFKQANPELKKAKEAFDIIPQSISEYILSESFILRLLHHYHESNQDVIEPLVKFKEIRYAPWITKSGNDSSEVLQVYLEKSEAINQLSITPASAKDLLKRIILLGRSMSIKEKKAHQKNPHKLIPAKMKGIHSFSLMLGHSSLFEALEAKVDMDHWIKTLVEDPGEQIATAMILPETTEDLLDFCKKKIVKSDLQVLFTDKSKDLSTQLSHKEFRQVVLNIIQEMDPAEDAVVKERSRLFDMELCKLLPLQLRKILKKSAVHFADTNWSVGVHDLHFCFIINPGNGKMELWEVYDNGSPFIALDQKYWLTDRDWEFCLPQGVLPENEGLHL
jgi:hypothetical protein